MGQISEAVSPEDHFPRAFLFTCRARVLESSAGMVSPIFRELGPVIDRPFRLAAEYVVLISWSFDYDTLIGIAEQVEYDDRLTDIEKLGLESYITARENVLKGGPIN